MNYETKVRQLEAEGMTRSDAQAVVDAQELSGRTTGPAKITILYTAADGFSKTAEFTDLQDARDYAQTWMGKHVDIAPSYAVSGDGLSTLHVDGVSLSKLFGEAS